MDGAAKTATVSVEGLAALAIDPSTHGFAWLDSGPFGTGWVATNPTEELRSESWSALAELDQRWRARPDEVWIGWIGYDFGVAHHLGRRRVHRTPGLLMRRYRSALRLEPTARPDRFLAVGVGDATGCEDLRRRAASTRGAPRAAWPFSALQTRWTPDQYRARVARALECIGAGETYQINLAQRFEGQWLDSDVPLDPACVGAYLDLRRRAPAPMGGLVQWEHGWVLSNSPETLLDLRFEKEGWALARSFPIKGTRPTSEDPRCDAAAQAELRASLKDAAEHVMIVDLVRNDLGRIAAPGTVQASPEPSAVRLPTVHHLVTEVSARVRAETSLSELWEALFPGGSITGAPKRRTLELIDDLEEAARGVYCGALLLLEPRGLTASITIRTAHVDRAGLEVFAGGGLVSDSDPEAERLETLAKVRAFGRP